jgi:hypothetical protein
VPSRREEKRRERTRRRGDEGPRADESETTTNVVTPDTASAERVDDDRRELVECRRLEDEGWPLVVALVDRVAVDASPRTIARALADPAASHAPRRDCVRALARARAAMSAVVSADDESAVDKAPSTLGSASRLLSGAARSRTRSTAGDEGRGLHRSVVVVKAGADAAPHSEDTAQSGDEPDNRRTRNAAIIFSAR